MCCNKGVLELWRGIRVKATAVQPAASSHLNKSPGVLCYTIPLQATSIDRFYWQFLEHEQNSGRLLHRTADNYPLTPQRGRQGGAVQEGLWGQSDLAEPGNYTNTKCSVYDCSPPTKRIRLDVQNRQSAGGCSEGQDRFTGRTNL